MRLKESGFYVFMKISPRSSPIGRKVCLFDNKVHMFFFRNGNYFKLDLYHNKKKDIASLLTPHEIKIQMERIVKEADRK